MTILVAAQKPEGGVGKENNLVVPDPGEAVVVALEVEQAVTSSHTQSLVGLRVKLNFKHTAKKEQV